MFNIENGQAVIKHEPTGESSVGIDNPNTRAELNFRLGNELNDVILTPAAGIQKIRKVLNRYGLDIPALYDLDAEGDEAVLLMNQFGDVLDIFSNDDGEDASYYLYILYHLTDTGIYDFYAELTDEEGIERLYKENDEIDNDEDV